MTIFGRSRELQERLQEAERARDELAARLDAVQNQRTADLQMLDGLGEALLGLDRNRRIAIANRRFVELFRQSGNVIGKSIGDVLRISQVFDAFDRALAGEEAIESFSVRVGVAERKIEMRALPQASDSMAAVALFIDVTAIDRLEQIRRDFISDFSHEVRTPLAGLRSAVETFDANANKISAEEDHQLRRIMVRQLRRLERLVDDLAELSRIEAGDLSLDLRNVNIRKLIDDVCEDFADQAAQHHVRFVIAGEADAHADPHRVQQAFSNLIDNAIKYGGDGQQVEIKVGVEGNAAVVRITDHGEGIPASERENVFRRFYRIDKSRSQDIPGSGLGLAITKHLILQQRGSIDVESDVGKGATFIVRLPRSA